MAHNLSEGLLQVLLSGGYCGQPVFQVLEIKEIQGRNEKYHLLLSDGIHTQTVYVLATEITELIDGQLTEYSVIRIDKYITSLSNDSWNRPKRFIIVLGLTVLAPGNEVGQKLGDPKSLYIIHPITSLTKDQTEWVIKARVESKSQINSSEGGNWFSMHLTDESGRIRAVFFKYQCDEFYNRFEPDRVYYISGFRVQETNQAYTPDQLELVVDYKVANAYVVECTEEAWTRGIVDVAYDFVPFEEIALTATGSLIDLIGVCKTIPDAVNVEGARTHKRELTLIDANMREITLTLWNNDAIDFDQYEGNPVVVVKAARVKEFNGVKYVSCLASSLVRVNPDLPEAHSLRELSQSLGSQFRNISI